MFAMALVGRPAAATERYAVVVGNNLGDSREVPLRYAEDDAVRMADVLTSVGGFAFENVIVMRSPDATAVRHAILGLNERLRALSDEAGRDSMLLVYYSGHSDARALHLGDTPLELLELERMVRGSPARFRIMVADSCRSGALTRTKAGAPGGASGRGAREQRRRGGADGGRRGRGRAGVGGAQGELLHSPPGVGAARRGRRR
jgi:hypothetical protein